MSLTSEASIYWAPAWSPLGINGVGINSLSLASQQRKSALKRQQSPRGRTYVRGKAQRASHGAWDTVGSWQVFAFFSLFLAPSAPLFLTALREPLWGGRSRELDHGHQTNAVRRAQLWPSHAHGFATWALSVPSCRASPPRLTVRELRVLRAGPAPSAPHCPGRQPEGPSTQL